MDSNDFFKTEIINFDKLNLMFDLEKVKSYNHKFKRVLEEDTFKKKHFQQFHSLTQREKEILRLVTLGQTNQQISIQLFVSPDTVRTHRNRIWQKLEIKNLVGAIQFAQAFDLI